MWKPKDVMGPRRELWMPLRRMLSKRKPPLAVDTRILEVMCTTQRMMACQHFCNRARCRTFGLRQVVGLAPLVAVPALAVDARSLQVICSTHSMLASQQRGWQEGGAHLGLVGRLVAAQGWGGWSLRS